MSSTEELHRRLVQQTYNAGCNDVVRAEANIETVPAPDGRPWLTIPAGYGIVHEIAGNKLEAFRQENLLDLRGTST